MSEAIDGFITQHGLERRVIACNRGGVDKVLAEHGLSRRSHVTVPHFHGGASASCCSRT
ncbi:MAG: hypothetical protein WDO24_22240 [Pseudomonadota bacterium]